MRVVVAPAAFKGTLHAADAAAAIARGVRAAGAEAVEIPVADGGEGTLDALVAGGGGTIMGVIARGPLGLPVRAHLGRLDDGTGVVEMAQASGLSLVAERERDAMRASSQGTGEMIRQALARRPPRIVVGLGDSAVCDGGLGLAAALGVRFLDDEGVPLGDGGGALERLARIDASGLDPRVRGVALVAAADVAAPLADAARVYAPQKGASPGDVAALLRGLDRLAKRIDDDMGRPGIASVPGGGAAGGCGAMLAALGAEIRSGAEVVLEVLRFREGLAGADLVITGEGRIDDQTPTGKAPHAVLGAARAAGIPCAALAGEATATAGFDEVRTLAEVAGHPGHPALGLAELARRLVDARR